MVPAEIGQQRIAAQLLAIGRNGSGKSEVALRQAPCFQCSCRQAVLEQLRLRCDRQLVAQLDEGGFVGGAGSGLALVRVVAAFADPAFRAGGDHLVERGDLVACPDIASIDAVVGEILFAQHAVLVADQAVLADRGGIELDLDLHVLGDGEERGAHLVAQHLLRFQRGVDIGVIAVTVVGDLFHHRLVVIACPEAERGERDAAVALPFDHVDQRVGVGNADVEIAVRGQDHAVHAALDEALLGHGIGEFEPRSAGGRSACAEPGEGGTHLGRAAGGFEHDARAARVDDDRHLVLAGHFPGKAGKTRLAAGRSSRGRSYPRRPTRTSFACAFHGLAAVSSVTENGLERSCGAA